MHLAPTIQAVAKKWNGNVTVVAESDMPAKRVEQGWTLPDFTPARLVITPAWPDRIKLIEQSAGPDDVHVFMGIQAYPQTYRTLKHVRRLVPRIGIWAEPPRQNEGQVKTMLRRIRYTSHALRWRNRLDFLLTTGTIGQKWYSQCGFRSDKIFRVGYFFPELKGTSCRSSEGLWPGTHEQPRIMFVGELEHHKGVDLLLRALAPLKHYRWSLLVVGKGSLRNTLIELAKDLGLEERARWITEMPNRRLVACMSFTDFLVLPSRHDGWGAVVTEALSTGTPVLVSNACGAADAISSPLLGSVFSTEDVIDLSRVLETYIQHGVLTDSKRRIIQEASSKIMHPDVVADYLIRIVNQNKDRTAEVSPPWA